MLLKSIPSFVAVVTLSITAASAATPMMQAQRHCQSDDLNLSPVAKAQYTYCVWKQEDSSAMQVTLHLTKDVDFVMGRCTFGPVAGKEQDKVVSVKTSKSGLASGSQKPFNLDAAYQIINGNEIKFIARNFNSFLDGSDYPSHMNILFDLGDLTDDKFTPGDAIQCEFLPL